MRARCGSADEIVERERRTLPTAAEISASSGSAAPATSQPWRAASARKADTLRRPISRLRAISRSESPWRSRASTCRYWNISILRRPIARSLRLGWPESSDDRPAVLEMPVLHLAQDWLLYAEIQVAPICRKPSGS